MQNNSEYQLVIISNDHYSELYYGLKNVARWPVKILVCKVDGQIQNGEACDAVLSRITEHRHYNLTLSPGRYYSITNPTDTEKKIYSAILSALQAKDTAEAEAKIKTKTAYDNKPARYKAKLINVSNFTSDEVDAIKLRAGPLGVFKPNTTWKFSTCKQYNVHTSKLNVYRFVRTDCDTNSWTDNTVIVIEYDKNIIYDSWFSRDSYDLRELITTLVDSTPENILYRCTTTYYGQEQADRVNSFLAKIFKVTKPREVK